MTFDPIPHRQILSYRVRGPELAAIYGLIQQEGPLSAEKLIQTFVGMQTPGEPASADMLLDALDYLRAVELIGRRREEDGTQIYQIIEDNTISGFPFALLLLSQLHQVIDNRNAFRVVHRLAVERDMFMTSRAQLLRQLEGQYPEDYAWNTEKLRAWGWLSSYLGLSRSLESREVDLMICPESGLLLTTLKVPFGLGLLNGDLQGNHVKTLLGNWLNYVNQHLMDCFTERRTVYYGLAAALLSMETQGMIKLDMVSDAPGALFLRDRRVSHISFSL